MRGSSPTPAAANLGYGGNTCCMEVRSPGGQRIIVDAGTGVCNLGRLLVAEAGAENIHLHLFLTHFHWDHIQGIPFFAPLLKSGSKVTFYSFPGVEQIEKRLQRQMSAPFFTLDFQDLPATREFCQIKDETFKHGDLTVTSFALHHPQKAYGYRIECDGAAVVIATDFEHGNQKLDRVLLEHCEGADMLVYDAQYTPAEYTLRKGWGHSTYAEAARFANQAGVKKLLLFHHDPAHDDSVIDGIVEQAGRLFQNVAAAREQCTITV